MKLRATGSASKPTRSSQSSDDLLATKASHRLHQSDWIQYRELSLSHFVATGHFRLAKPSKRRCRVLRASRLPRTSPKREPKQTRIVESPIRWRQNQTDTIIVSALDLKLNSEFVPRTRIKIQLNLTKNHLAF